MKYKLYVFDVDGTLTPAWEDVLLPGVVAWFEQRPSAALIALATNQGGVACRLHGWGKQYPSMKEVETRLDRICEALPGIEGTAVHRYVAFAFQTKKGKWLARPKTADAHDPRWLPAWRKPNPGMLLQALADTGCLPHETVMVGDRDSDRETAVAANCDFVWADQFFERTG